MKTEQVEKYIKQNDVFNWEDISYNQKILKNYTYER